MSTPFNEGRIDQAKDTLEAYLMSGVYELSAGQFESYAKISEVIAYMDAPGVIAVDGPTSSGKTSLTQSLVEHYERQGLPVTILPLDYLLTDRDTRHIAYQSIVEGRMGVAEYSGAAWEHARYRQVLEAATDIMLSAAEPQTLIIPSTYNRSTGRSEITQPVRVYPGGIIITEGVGLHAYHGDLMDSRVRVDVRDDDALLQRIFAREQLKDPASRLAETYLQWRYTLVDLPHTAYLRSASSGCADYVVDTSDQVGMLVYKKI